MDASDYISIHHLCSHYNVPDSFMKALHEFELIELIAIQNKFYVRTTQIRDIEKIIRLHFELDINLEGIDAIYHLLKQVDSLQNDIIALNNKLSRFEDY